MLTPTPRLMSSFGGVVVSDSALAVTTAMYLLSARKWQTSSTAMNWMSRPCNTVVHYSLSSLAPRWSCSRRAVRSAGDSHDFIRLDGRPEVALIAGIVVLRPEEPLFFASAERVVATVLQRLDALSDIRSVVLSLEEGVDLDSTPIECLTELDGQLRRRRVVLVLARVKEPVRALLGRFDADGL